MRFLDEEIIKKREDLKREKFNTLESGIYMDGKILKFTCKNFFDIFSIFVPNLMKQMPKEYARIKYPSEFRPQIILTTMDLSVNMGFTVFPNELIGDGKLKLLQHMREAVQRSNSDYKMYSCELLPDIQGGYFAFRSHAMDSDVYNMLLLSDVENNLIQGNFNCYYEDYEKWKSIVLMMWNTISIPKEEVSKI